MSTLKKYQKEPKSLLNTALHMYRSKKIKTAIVEGTCDKRFLSQWSMKADNIRFDGFDGKTLVESVYAFAQYDPYAKYDFLYFFADIDYDVITKTPVVNRPNFIYNAYCFETNKLFYNDLETYLINTSAFEKVLVNFDIESSNAESMRLKLEKASREIGSFRAADIILQKQERLYSSILNGLEIKPFFDSKSISIDLDSFKDKLPKWSNYPTRIPDLIEIADTINRDNPTMWSLSRGHDLTEMLSLHLEFLGKRGMHQEKLELLLRLACELTNYKNSPMGQQIKRQNADCHFFAYVQN